MVAVEKAEPGLGRDHERVESLDDAATGLRGVIAIHSRALGPAMGGVRLSVYPGPEAATADALLLSRAMTLKNSAAGLDLGGGKAVLIDDGRWGDPVLREERLRAFGREIERLDGDYVTAEDVGTAPADMVAIGRETGWVAGRPRGEGGRGDPSSVTARTVFAAVAAGAEARLGADSVGGLRVGVLGTGHVGSHLARLLAEGGATVLVADLDRRRAAALAAEVDGAVADPAELVLADLDVLCPCALGGVIEAGTVDRLRARVIAGAANNQLADPALAAALAGAGVLYVPDFLANSGGIIDVAAEILGYDDREVERRLVEAELRIGDLLARAAEQGRTPWDLAVELAWERVARAAIGAAAGGRERR
ncbi:MAG TPA: Glu/Leu/Phe/Val dehydrogenase dimerization domain-containing protein [Solirubrobacterales bacterium]|nr:Glu/Leu/Phe/Val dehydrogenase dimerization domain-containing protein [Solirubrobacterales bacterium]